MSLNQCKKISFIEEKSKSTLFWEAPFPPKARFQMRPTPNTKFLGGLPVVFGQQQKKKWWLKKKRKQSKHLKLRFFFSSSVFNSIFLFKKFSKSNFPKYGKFPLKKQLLLINKLFCKKKRYNGYALSSIKGGYFTTVLGFRSFMPKSHSERLLTNRAPIEWLIGLKVDQRRKRFSVRDKKTTVNIVSSSKFQQKGVRLKKGERMKGRGQYWRHIASIVNKRIEKEEQEQAV